MNNDTKSDCFQISMLMGERRGYGSRWIKFNEWLLSQCALGRDTNELTLGQWADEFELVSK